MSADEAFCQRARKVYPAGFMLTLLHHDVTVFQAGLTLGCKMESYTAFCAVVESFVLTFPFSYAHARPPARIVLRLLYIVFFFFLSATCFALTHSSLITEPLCIICIYH